MDTIYFLVHIASLCEWFTGACYSKKKNNNYCLPQIMQLSVPLKLLFFAAVKMGKKL